MSWCCICAASRVTEYGRIIMANGAAHVMERCQTCGGNARGAGRWVPAREVLPRLVSELPVFRDCRTLEDLGHQPTLF